MYCLTYYLCVTYVDIYAVKKRSKYPSIENALVHLNCTRLPYIYQMIQILRDHNFPGVV